MHGLRIEVLKLIRLPLIVRCNTMPHKPVATVWVQNIPITETITMVAHNVDTKTRQLDDIKLKKGNRNQKAS